MKICRVSQAGSGVGRVWTCSGLWASGRKLYMEQGGAATAGICDAEKSTSSQLAGRKAIGRKMTLHRWPHSIHSQVEAVFHSIRSVREAKADNPVGVRSFGAWRVYRYESHRFVENMKQNGRADILDEELIILMSQYLDERLLSLAMKKRSRQTFETTLCGLGKFEYALNNYIRIHEMKHPGLDSDKLRMAYYAKARKFLAKSSSVFENRAYPDPIGLIQAIKNGVYQLQASLQYEGGMRTEGVGAPSSLFLKNPLKREGLRGIGRDPVTGAPAGMVATVEKGGKETKHLVSVETYRRLEQFIDIHGQLESDYLSYVEAIGAAAKETGQYASGRGTHGLKHSFAQERYLECVNHGFSHEEALQQTSIELSHFRMRETLGYTRGG